MSDELFTKMIKPGKKLKIFYTEKNLNNKTLHVRAIVDDEYVVCKRWMKHKQYWLYEVYDILDLWHLYEKGKLT